MEEYLERFGRMVEDLAGDPRVRVTHFWMGVPAREAELLRVEKELNQPLPQSVRDFFAQANGLQLRWLDVGHPCFEPADGPPVSEYTDFLQGDDDTANAVINIHPVGRCFLESDEPEIRCFDDFSAHGSMAFRITRGRLDPQVFMGDDYNANWNTAVTDFASYLEMILRYRGDIESRVKMFSAHKTVVAIDRGPPISLDRLLPPRRYVAVERALGARVSFADHRHGSARLRGVVTDVARAGTTPRDWPYGQELLRVRTDLGGDVYVPRRLAESVERDAYEDAFASPHAYLNGIRTTVPAAARGMMRSLLGQQKDRVRHGTWPIAVPSAVWSGVAAFRSVGADELIAGLAGLVRGWLAEWADSRPTSVEAATELLVVSELASAALVVVLARAVTETPSRELGNEATRELRALVDRIDAHVRSLPKSPWPPELSEHAAYFESALRRAAVGLEIPRVGDGRAFGLDPIPVLVG
jgi:hypothetical protein